jgi:hypothetical protein
LSVGKAEQCKNNKQCHHMESRRCPEVGIRAEQIIHHALKLAGDGMLSID